MGREKNIHSTLLQGQVERAAGIPLSAIVPHIFEGNPYGINLGGIGTGNSIHKYYLDQVWNNTMLTFKYLFFLTHLIRTSTKAGHLHILPYLTIKH